MLFRSGGDRAAIHFCPEFVLLQFSHRGDELKKQSDRLSPFKYNQLPPQTWPRLSQQRGRKMKWNEIMNFKETNGKPYLQVMYSVLAAS